MILYLFKVTILIAAFYLFYKLLLRNETFYKVNRFVLLGCLIISFLLPFITLPSSYSFVQLFSVKQESFFDYEIFESANVNPLPPESPAVQSHVQEQYTMPDFLQWIIHIYWIGVIIFTANFLLQLLVIFYRIYKNPWINESGFKIVEITGDRSPCSFLNFIFINPSKYDWDTYSQILQHEKIHIKQYHTVDMLLAEIAVIFQWFNPFAWTYRKEIENNIEFQTDHCMLQNTSGDEIQRYQVSLLQVSVPQYPLRFTTNYNQSLLKQRLFMMNTTRSSFRSGWKYISLVILICFLISVVANSVPIKEQQFEDKISQNQSGEYQNALRGTWEAETMKNEIQITLHNELVNKKPIGSFLITVPDYLNTLLSEASLKVERDAGFINLVTSSKQKKHAGIFEFKPNPVFINELEKNDVIVEDKDLLQFYILNINISFIENLNKLNLGHVRSTDLISAVSAGVDIKFIQSFLSKGFKDLTLQDFVTFKMHGITPESLGSGIHNQKVQVQNSSADLLAKSNQVGNVSSANISSNPVHNNSAEFYIQSLAEVGYKNLTVSNLTVLKAAKVTPEYINELKSVGYSNLSPGMLASFKVHRISGELILAYKELGLKNISPGKLVIAVSSGVSPQYIQSMIEKGFISDDIETYMPAISNGNR